MILCISGQFTGFLAFFLIVINEIILIKLRLLFLVWFRNQSYLGTHIITDADICKLTTGTCYAQMSN